MGGREWQTIMAVDSEGWACEVYRANFPAVEARCATVADTLKDLPYADVYLGGPPCQDFSTAGKGEGEDDELRFERLITFKDYSEAESLPTEARKGATP